MNSQAFSVLGLFDDAQSLMNAIPAVKARVAGRLEAYTPYPIHGLEKALGLRKSPWAHGLYHGAHRGDLRAGFPTVDIGRGLSAGDRRQALLLVGSFRAHHVRGDGAFRLLHGRPRHVVAPDRLPFFRHPMLRSRSMPLIMRDKFALAVESEGQPLDVDLITTALREAGAQTIEVIDQPAAPDTLSAGFLLRVSGGIAIACLLAGYLTYWGVKLFRLPCLWCTCWNSRGSIPKGRKASSRTVSECACPSRDGGTRPTALHDQERTGLGGPRKSFAQDGECHEKRPSGFATHCSACHGILGNGAPTLTAAYGAKPANLVSETVSGNPDGSIYHVIVMGKNAMPSYAAELTEDKRWAVVHYVRVLQRAMNARDTDIPKETPR